MGQGVYLEFPGQVTDWKQEDTPVGQFEQQVAWKEFIDRHDINLQDTVTEALQCYCSP